MSMHIVAVGGGNKEPAIRHAMNRMENSSVLIVPTACSTPLSYNKKVAACTAFFEKLGLPSVVLHELGEIPTPTKVDHEFGRAGMLYTLGGHLPTLLEQMPGYGTDVMRRTVQNGTPHGGTSAGALWPFERMHSCPVKRPEQVDWDYAQLSGASLLRAIATAHANQHDDTPDGLRPDSRLDNLMADFPADMSLGIGIENGAALVIDNDSSFVLSAREDARLHILQPTVNGLDHVALGQGDALTPQLHAQLTASTNT